MHPRFTIHSWNDDQTVNEARDVSGRDLGDWCSAIELALSSAALSVYVLWQAHADDEPMLRPTFLDREHDPQTFAERDDFCWGAICWSPASSNRTSVNAGVLPENCSGWYDFL